MKRVLKHTKNILMDLELPNKIQTSWKQKPMFVDAKDISSVEIKLNRKAT